MSANPRLSGLWMTDSRRGSYFAEDEEDVALVQEPDEEMGTALDGRTPLDRTIDRIGMGACACCYSACTDELTRNRLQGATSGRFCLSAASVSLIRAGSHS